MPEAADAIGVGQEGLRLPSVHPPSISLPSLGKKIKNKKTRTSPSSCLIQLQDTPHEAENSSGNALAL